MTKQEKAKRDRNYGVEAVIDLTWKRTYTELWTRCGFTPEEIEKKLEEKFSDKED